MLENQVLKSRFLQKVERIPYSSLAFSFSLFCFVQNEQEIARRFYIIIYLI